ncbi:MAG TPA: hypothetical protein VEJ67_08165 [Candidatus Cybelea sp.]|nr:hypothetical protein [Candidatus Cybelea sp.]
MLVDLSPGTSILHALVLRRDKRIFARCLAGVDRTGVMIRSHRTTEPLRLAEQNSARPPLPDPSRADVP